MYSVYNVYKLCTKHNDKVERKLSVEIGEQNKLFVLSRVIVASLRFAINNVCDNDNRDDNNDGDNGNYNRK